MGHTIPVTCDTVPAMGMGYAGTGETHNFKSYTMVLVHHQYCSIILQVHT